MKLQHRQSFHSIHQQNGAVLAISLILLLAVTIIGTTSMQTSTLQERMAGNTNDHNTAFQDAESGLRDGELFIQGASNIGPFLTASTATALYLPATPGNTERWSDSSIWNGGSISGTAPTSQYIIEKLPENTGNTGSLEAGTPEVSSGYFRVTARSTGASSSAQVMLQTVYKQQ